MKGLPVLKTDRLLASWNHGEDAALWKITEDRIGILTIDFITPVVDDPRRFGEIAAANSLSDVYAMGGDPIIALNVVCFPTSCEPLSVLQEILDGGANKIIEANAMLAGGHSVQDQEPKYGLVVFGEVDAKAMWTVGTAREGDALILTKPLGTGIAVTAIKAGLFAQENIEAAELNMAKLNAVPPLFPKKLREKVSACTDLTGFGLASHALDLASGGTSLEIECARVPLLPGIEEMANMGLLPAGSYENKKYVGDRVINESPLGRFAEDIAFDPQTSGGLLIAAPRDACEEMLPILRANGFERSEIIGRFVAGDEKLYLK